MKLHTNTLTPGIDIGPTTVKVALLNQASHIVFPDHECHCANIQETLTGPLKKAHKITGPIQVIPVMTGFGGFTLSSHLEVPFVQEVAAVASVLQDFTPQTDVAIELGGKDAKIIYFIGGIDQRMNGICAGGTGSFIDQMAVLLQTDASGLNDYAEHYKAIYPIAAYCDVFVKPDIQPLINEGATREDLAAFILQVVVNQTISGLACGKSARGNVALLGGPLHSLSQFRGSFICTLHLTPEQVIVPDHSHLFAVVGAAMNPQDNQEAIPLETLIQRLSLGIKMDFEVKRMEPLFKNQEGYDRPCARHASNHVKSGDLSSYEGCCYLDIDAGLTTAKAALVGEGGTLLYRFYDNNNGDPLATAIRATREIKEQLPEAACIAYSCPTGHGEASLKAALMLNEGEVEATSYYYAAVFFESDMDCILDIDGQDMKCIKIKDGTVDSVRPNEACSSGRGSFIETFARSLNYSVEDFAREALFAKNPTDLGTRCTIFMNFNVKQAQKEGATVTDISVGLAYLVIKNTLSEVIKITNASDLGEHVVVQGGTLYSDAVLRSSERISGCPVVHPDIADIMGAFGAAPTAREHYHMASEPETSVLSLERTIGPRYSTPIARCKGCNNHCVLTTNQSGSGCRSTSGSRCERGLGLEKAKKETPNLFNYRYHRMFDYESLPMDQADRGTVGIPRVLNMHENFPFWAVSFKKLRYHVVPLPQSTRQLYELGIESTPSGSECYLAKLVYGHVTWLIKQGVKFIFYPYIPYERDENPDAGNHYNCPMVTSHVENIKNNVEALAEENVRFMNPFMAFTDEETLTDTLVKEFLRTFQISAAGVRTATRAAWQKLTVSRDDLMKKGEETLAWLKEHGERGTVLAGRPYHVNPETHHGIPELITSYGFVVLTEDSISHLGRVGRPLVVTNQWMYHSRLYTAVSFVKTQDNLDLIRLNSFGCGPDTVTTDQVANILTHSGEIYTVLKVDEVNNLGVARTRIRSLIVALEARDQRHFERRVVSSVYHRVVLTKEMEKDYTLLCPQMPPTYPDLLEPVTRSFGYKIEVLQNHNRSAVGVGPQYVNNDTCYSFLIVIGQIMDTLLSGKYDLDHTAVLMSQTDDGRRASNYIGLIHRALEKAGMPQIPVISVNVNGMETNPGFAFTVPPMTKAIQAIVYGDIFMRVLYATRPYKAEPGSVSALHMKWKARCIVSLSKKNATMIELGRNIKGIIRDFDAPPRLDVKKPKVGIVGEILMKFLPLANNHIVELLEPEGAEAVVSDLMDFLLYSLHNSNFKAEHLGSKKSTARLCNAGIVLLEYFRGTAREELTVSMHFTLPSATNELAQMAKGFASLGSQIGGGQFLTGEMLELIHSGVNSIICTQSFGCLPNHIVDKSVIKELRRNYPLSNIIAVDYDPGVSEVNQLNRIKPMLATAQKNLKTESSREDRGDGRRPVTVYSPCLGTMSHT